MKEDVVGYRQRFLRAKYSQYALVALLAVLSGYLVVYLSILIRFTGVPSQIGVMVSLTTAFGLPIFLVKTLTRFWALDTKDFANDHPSGFLAKMRDIRQSGMIMEFGGAILAALIVGNLKVGSQLSDVLFFASINLSIVEFVTMGVIVYFWRPDPHYMLLASLESEADPERNQNDTWLDGSIEWFNAVLGLKKSPIVVRNELNLEALLFDRTFRKLSIDRLHYAAKTENTQNFIEEISSLMGKHPTEIVERNSLAWKVKTQTGNILGVALGVLGILIPLSPLLIPALQQLIQAWLNLFH